MAMQAPAPRKSWRDSARVCRLLPGNLRRNREGLGAVGCEQAILGNALRARSSQWRDICQVVVLLPGWAGGRSAPRWQGHEGARG